MQEIAFKNYFAMSSKLFNPPLGALKHLLVTKEPIETNGKLPSAGEKVMHVTNKQTSRVINNSVLFDVLQSNVYMTGELHIFILLLSISICIFVPNMLNRHL